MLIHRPTRRRPFFALRLLLRLFPLILIATRDATSQTASPAYAGCRTGGWTPPAAWTRLVDQAATEWGAELCLANCKAGGYDWGGFECPALGTGLVHCQCTNTFDATLAADNAADCTGAHSLAHCTGPFQAGAYPLGAHSRAAVYTLSAWTPTLPPCGNFLASGPTAAGGAYVHDMSADCTVSSTVQVPAEGLSVSGPADLADRPTISGCFAGESVFYVGHAWSTLNLSRIEIDLRGCLHSLRHVSVGNHQGAIGTALYLDHVVLRGGRAVNGGQLLATNAWEVVARDSEFRDGLATSGGGSLFISILAGEGESDHQFYHGNIATRCSIVRCTVADNTANVLAGAFYSFVDAGQQFTDMPGGRAKPIVISALNSTFERNRANGAPGGEGGAFVIRSRAARINIQGTTATENTAGNNGGFMYLESYDPRVESMVMVSDSTFRSNIATHGSGGAFADIAGGESGMQIYRTKFEDNKASLGGGAIIMSGSKGLVLVDAEFIGNSAGSSGGAFQVDNGKMSMVRGRVVGSLGRPQLIPPEKPTRLTSQEWNWNKCNDPEGEDKCKAGQGVCRGHSDCVGALRCSQKAEYVNTWGWEPLGSYGGLAMCYRPTGAAVHLTTSGLTTMFDVHMAADNRPANITAIPPVTIIESPSLRASVSESQVLELGTEQLITTCVGAAATTQCIELGFLGCTSGSERCSCPAGTIHRHDAFGAASEVCIPCTPGLWSPNIGMAGSACQACPAGYNQPRPRATSCLSCSPGTYQDQTAQTNCLSCSLNTFSAEQNATVCEECDIGRTSEYGAARCATCGAGKFRASTSGSVNCSSCAPNTFSDSPGASNCKSCPTGFKATLNGSVSCSRCGAGRFGAGCVECPIGWARTESAPSSLSCDQCDAGQSSDTKGSAKCTSCGAGRYSNVTGEGCKNCDKGRYRVVGKNENQDDPKRCDACPEGYYQDAEGQASCLPCLPGWFGNVTGMRACHECDIGKVSEGQNATRCSDCDAGQSSDTKGSAKCTSCGAGRYSNVTGEDCKNCPGGWRRGANEPPKRCVQCALGETTKSGAMSCDTCDLGKYGNPSSPGLCVTCEPGKYQDAKGETSCKPCPASRWSGDKEATSLGECKLCSDDRSTGNRTGVWNIRQCMCKKDAYFDDASAAGVGKANINILNVDDETLPACVACPRGAACPVDGSTLMYLHARSGFWQPENQTSAFFDCGSAFSDVALGARARARCCPAAAQCDRVPRLATWKAADQCEPGYSGPLCIVCAEDHLLFDSECIPCDGGSPLWIGVMGILIVGFIIFLAVAILLKRIENVKSAEHEDGNTKLARVGGLVSILVSWLQILSAFTVTFKMRWPSNFAAYSKGSGTAVNLEVFSFLAMGNCAFAIPFINKFLLQIFTPPVFIAAVFLAWFVLRICDRKKRALDRQGAVQHARTAQAWQFGILIVQLLYPKLATNTFQMFRCVNLGDRLGLLLEADLSKICFEGVHMTYVPFAVLSAVVYLAGVPAGVFFGLRRNRGRLDQFDMQSKFGELYRKYENSHYFWECILMLQKCMLTGAMCAIAPGSPLQLLVAVFVCMAYLLLILHAHPFKGSLEDHLAFLTSLCLTTSLVLGFALITDDRDAPWFDMNVAGVLLILINILPFPYWAFAVSRIVRYGPNYGMLTSAEAGSWSEDGSTKLDGPGSDGEERGRRRRPPRIKMKRQLSMVEIRRVVDHDKVVILQATSNKHRAAFVARIKEREARADARVKMRLTERTAAKARAGRRPEAMKEKKKKTAVMPLVGQPMSKEDIRTWSVPDKNKKKKNKKKKKKMRNKPK